MSSWYTIKDKTAAHYLTLTIVGWIDIFTRKIYRLVIDLLNYCREEKGLEIYGFVIMSNHIHLIARARDGFILSDVLRDFKKFTSKQIINAFKNAVELHTNEFMIEKWDYLHNNPVRAGIVEKPEDYLYSSAGNYTDREG